MSASAIVAQRLTPAHLAHLRTSRLSDETIALARLFSLREGQVSAHAGRPWPQGGDALAFPFYLPGDAPARPSFVRFRPDHPRSVMHHGELQPIKYDQRPGPRPIVFFPPRTLASRLRASSDCLWTEGEKKSLLLDQLGYCAVGLPGTDAHDKAALRRGDGFILRGWICKYLRIKGRRHIIVFDADAATKPDVRAARQRLATMLYEEGASEVLSATWPETQGKGVDDLYAGGGAGTVSQVIKDAQLLPKALPRPMHGLRGVDDFPLTFASSVAALFGAVGLLFWYAWGRV